VSRATPATAALDRAGVAYRLATYAYDPDADRIGLHAAAALGAPATALAQAYVNGGQRGLQLRIAPADLVRVTGAAVAAVSSGA
jgi:prolyl-tRNA editing enzyme YbaK/EbsC (Cys-tRNA(Pro) deacylase)